MPKTECYFGCVFDDRLHRFPNPLGCDIDRFNSWKAVLSNEIQARGDKYVYNNVRLCYKHFQQCYHLPSKKITRNAIPTLNLVPGIIQEPVEVLLTEDQTGKYIYKRDSLGVRETGGVIETVPFIYKTTNPSSMICNDCDQIVIQLKSNKLVKYLKFNIKSGQVELTSTKDQTGIKQEPIKLSLEEKQISIKPEPMELSLEAKQPDIKQEPMLPSAAEKQFYIELEPIELASAEKQSNIKQEPVELIEIHQITKMDKSRAEYMRDYRRKKREEKLKTANVEPKKIARNSTQRSRDFRARERNSILSQTSTANPNTASPNLDVSRATLRLPLSHLSRSTATACNTGPADVEQERVVREDVEQVERIVNNSTDRKKLCGTSNINTQNIKLETTILKYELDRVKNFKSTHRRGRNLLNTRIH